MRQDSSNPVTALLVRWREGDRQALDALIPMVYSELHRLARYHLQHERSEHTLQSTALVHEAYMRLVGHDPPQWQNRAHFFGIAAHIMRQILVECARRRDAAKRGDNPCRITLDEALPGLSEMDEQQSRIVELRSFAGLTIKDTSEVLGISPATVKRDRVTVRAWLYHAITGESPA